MPTGTTIEGLTEIAESAERATKAFVEGTLPITFDSLLVQYAAHLCHELAWLAKIKFAQSKNCRDSVDVGYPLPDAILNMIRTSRLDFEVTVSEGLEKTWIGGYAEVELCLGNFHGQAWSKGLSIKFIKY